MALGRPEENREFLDVGQFAKVVAATGLSVAAYVRRIKLNQASERLILTSASASTISAELGFSSDSSMRRMFKELTALTPLEYRQAFGRN
jgi:transcriptional regulator GlxA family with amidase domain